MAVCGVIYWLFLRQIAASSRREVSRAQEAITRDSTRNTGNAAGGLAIVFAKPPAALGSHQSVVLLLRLGRRGVGLEDVGEPLLVVVWDRLERGHAAHCHDLLRPTVLVRRDHALLKPS